MLLVALSLAYMVAEFAVALYAGVRDRSASLDAFSLDSLIELFLGSVLLWRLRVEAMGASTEAVETAERRASWWAGAAFYALAALILLGSGTALWAHVSSHPDAWGLGLAIASVLLMPLLSLAKRRIGKAIGSEALEAEAACTMVCAYMSATVLVGLAATRFLGWWWADPLAALALLYWVVREGRENFERAAGKASCCGCGH